MRSERIQKLLERFRKVYPDISWSHFRPTVGFSEFLVSLVAWALPSVFAVLLIHKIGQHHPTRYFDTAINQGISPQLWNVVGAIGLLFFGCCIVLIRIQGLFRLSAKLAGPVLRVASDMGLFGIGLMLGKLFIAFDSTPLLLWQMVFLGIAFGWLFFLMLFLNFILWLASRLVDSPNGPALIVRKAVYWHWPSQQFIGLFFVVVPVWHLWLEK